jgi:hypothetical protein
MILFELNCGRDHTFEGWFRDNATYDAQEKAREIVCPACGDTAVRKALMRPRIGKGGGKARDAAATEAASEAPAPESAAPVPESPQDLARRAAEQQAVALRQQLLELRAKVEADCDYVGPRFAEEARRIHHGEIKRHNIYGEASKEEAEALAEEGIEFGTIPWVQRSDA